MAARRAAPPGKLPFLDVAVPVSPVTLGGAVLVIVLWITGNVPSFGTAVGFLGLLAFVWLDVVNRGD